MRHNFINISKLVSVAILVSVLWSLAWADEWDKNYEKGKTQLERGEWELAIESIQIALNIRPTPDHQAATSSLKLVEYLPYFYLGKAYFFAGNYELALQNFKNSTDAGAVSKTTHWRNLQQMEKMGKQLMQLSNLRSSTQPSLNNEFEQNISALQNLILEEKFNQAANLLAQLKQGHSGDKRIAIFEKWLQKEQKKSALEMERSSLDSQAEVRFHKGLDFYILGQYEDALQAFRNAESLDPNFGPAKSWIRRTQSEMERLKLDDIESRADKKPDPEIIEKIITQTTAPVFAIRTPVAAVSETRSKTLILSGQAGDDRGIAYIELTLNGRPLLNASGETVVVQPRPEDNAQKFTFATPVPLKMGENQIVLTAYDIDSTPHRTTEQFTVTRKPPIYQTSAFGVSVGAFIILAIGGLFISKMVKYRIAIVNKYNPYIAGSPIRTEEMFYGREKLIKRILNTIHNNSLMIHGPRRIGKTSLQHHLKRRLENLQDPEFHFIPVMIDLQGTTEEHFFATLMEEIIEACKSSINGELKFRLYENKDTYSGRDLSRDLKSLLNAIGKKIDKKLKLVLLMDEVDELNKYSEQANQKLRSVFMKTFAENLVAVMSGAHIRKNWESEGSPWYNFFEEIEVPPLEREDAAQLIQKPVAGIFSYEEEALAKIIEYSECKPYVIQKFCIQVINRIIEDKRRKVIAEDVEAVASQVLSSAEEMSFSVGSIPVGSRR